MDLHHRSSQHPSTSIGNEVNMARTNFQYEKRQRELEKKRKAEEKAKRKEEAKRDAGEGTAPRQPGQEEPDAQQLQEEPAPQDAA
jgi:endonuclease I